MEILRQVALSFLNIAYIYGGKNPLVGFDCSGLVLEILRAVGEEPPATVMNSQQLFDYFSAPANHSSQDPQLGALCFYGITKESINHVAMCLDRRLFIEAGHGGESITSKELAAQRGAYVRIRPIRFGPTHQGFFLPDYSNISPLQ